MGMGVRAKCLVESSMVWCSLPVFCSRTDPATYTLYVICNVSAIYSYTCIYSHEVQAQPNVCGNHGQFHHYDISNEVIHRVNAYRNVFKFISAYLQRSTVIIMALQGLQYLSWALPFFRLQNAVLPSCSSNTTCICDDHNIIYLCTLTCRSSATIFIVATLRWLYTSCQTLYISV